MTNFKIFYEDIEVSSIDLNSLYDQFNKEYFYNELPKIPIKLSSRTKQSGGWVDGKRQHDGTIIPISMTISSFFKRTNEDEVKGIILHEMIHVWQYINGLAGHGMDFLNKLKELQKKVKFIIPLEDSVNNFEKSDMVKTTIKDVVLIFKNNNFSIVVCKNEMIKDNLFHILNSFGGMIKFDKVELFLIQSDEAVLNKYPIKTKWKNIQIYRIDTETANRLKKGKILYHVSEKNIDIMSSQAEKEHYEKLK